MPNRRKLGLCVLNLAGALIIAGAFYDLFVPNIPDQLQEVVVRIKAQGERCLSVAACLDC